MLDILNNKIIEELIEDVLLYGDCEFYHVIDKDIETEEKQYVPIVIMKGTQ